ncbi:MAG: serine hydrolase domain-containing protein [Bryobacteraceae bacterium]|nr:serine hydrolase domain-containing protein [Bryobacteraceae bacterium]
MTLRLSLAAAWLAGVAVAQTSPPPDAKAQLDRIFSQFAHNNTPGCAAGVGIGDKTVLKAAYGMADLERNVPNTTETVFEAGSVSKQFVAASLLLLVQRGKASLDDPARKYFPELPDYAPSVVALRHLMNHTSGLRDWGGVGAIAGKPRFSTVAYTNRDVLDIAARQRSLNYRAGDHYSYTNTGYNLLALFVGRVSGKTLAEFTKAEIFTPLQMTSSGWRDDFRRIVPNRAIAYEPTRDGFRTDMPFETAHGNGGMLTTIGDLLKWNLNFTHHRVGGKALAEAQIQRAKLNNGSAIAYAAGLMVSRWRGLQEVSHSGTTASYNAWLARYPEQQLSIALLCNVATNPTQLGRAVAEVFLKPVLGSPDKPTVVKGIEGPGLYRSTRDFRVLRLNGQDTGKPLPTTLEGDPEVFEKVEPSNPSPTTLEQFTGSYTSSEAGTALRAAVEGGKLVLLQAPDIRIPLSPTWADAFQGSIGSIRFLRNPAGQVTGLSVGSARVWDLRFRKVLGASRLVAPSPSP